MERVIAYIDGYNLYYGLRDKRWKWFYWLDIQAMAQHSAAGFRRPHSPYANTLADAPGMSVMLSSLACQRLT